MRVAVVGIVLATLLGVVTGIARLSNNWLLRNIAGGYIELIRNTPLLVQLFFWYFAVILKLPDLGQKISMPGVAMLSNRGMASAGFMSPRPGSRWFYWLLAGLVVAAVADVLRRRLARQDRVGSPHLGIAAFLVVAIVGLVSPI